MKIIKYLLLIFILLIGINVYAAGPSSDGYIAYYTYNYTDKVDVYTYIYNANEPNVTHNGISYDAQTNTLNLNNYSNFNYIDYGGQIIVHNMGDLKINVNGTNYVGTIKLESTNLLIDGSGILNSLRGITSESSVNVEIKNITLNGYREGNYGSGVLLSLSGDSNLSLENVTCHFSSNEIMYGSVGITAANVNLKNSKIYGSAFMLLISKKIVSTDSEINIYEYIPAFMMFENAQFTNSKINSIPLTEDSDLFEYMYALSIDESIRTNTNILHFNSMDSTRSEISGLLTSIGDRNSILSGIITGLGQTPATVSFINSEINAAGMKFGEVFMEKEKIDSLTFESSNIDLTGASTIKADKIIFNSGNLNIESKESPAIKTENIEINGGRIKSSSIEASAFTLADTHLMFLDNEDYKDVDTTNGLSATTLFEAYPEHEDPIITPDEGKKEETIIDVIKNVPNTGIYTIINLFLGIQLLILGGYLIVNKTRKKTI